MIPLYKPYMPEDLSELTEILYSGKLSYGKWGRLFEQELSRFIGEEGILTVNSYNSAMLVAITTMGLKPGDEVIASPMSCLASNQPLVTQGLSVKWADIDPLRGTLDPDSVIKQISSKTKAIFHNHYAGYLGLVEEINAIGKKFGLYVVDDAIEAFGSEYRGNKAGKWGADITVFSFQTVRLPNTIDGGGLAFNNEELFNKAKLIRDLGVDRTIFRDGLGEISPKCDITLPGFGATISEVNSYIGYKQMKELPELLNKQRKNAKTWYNELKGSGFDFVLTDSYSEPNYWVFGILTENKIKTIKEFRKKGFYASGIHLNNNVYSVFQNISHLKGVDDFYNKFVALPSGWWYSNNNKPHDV